MPVLLPPLPALASLKPRLNRFGADLTPALGGPVQRVNRLGSRWAVDVQMPSLDAACARKWLAARLQAESANNWLRLTWPEAECALPYAGVVVDGAGQAGIYLAVRGLPAHAPVPAGRFFTLATADGIRLYATVTDVVAGADGRAQLQLAPGLRRSPADADALSFNPVQMDGLADGATIDWELQLKRWTTFSFTLTEFQ